MRSRSTWPSTAGGALAGVSLAAFVVALGVSSCASPSLLGEQDDGGVLVDSGGDDDGCAAWLVPCGSTCVDPFSSNAHCGECDRPCGAGAGCVAGSCVPSVPTGPAPVACAEGSGPASAIGEEGELCTDALAAATFRRALCACGDVTLPSSDGSLLVDGFDSRAASYAPGTGTGSLAANGALDASSTVTVAGDLVLGGPHRVRGDTRVDGVLRAASLALDAPLTVASDAFVGGPITGTANATIAGALHVASCSAVASNVTASVCVAESVVIEPPCRCDGLPIPAIVAQHAELEHVDNDAVGLAPDVLSGPSASGRVDLACGRYYFTRIAVGGPTTIAAHGHVTIFVGGSILADAPIAFVPEPGATLDVFVAGTVLARAPLRLGAPDDPGATRFWVGGVCGGAASECATDADCCSTSCVARECVGGAGAAWAVKLTSAQELAAVVAAPAGTISAVAGVEVYGAVLSGAFESASAAIHFDGAIAETSACAPACARDPECGGEIGCGEEETCVAGCCVELEP